MHPEVRSDQPGKCPKCRGCDLVPLEPDSSTAQSTAIQSDADPHAEHRPGLSSHESTQTDESQISWLTQYRPFLSIIALILLASVLSAVSAGQGWQQMMTGFMAGFFLVFAGFKFIDLPGFVQGYSTYDLLARRVPAYGYVYACLELSLGLSYLTGFQPLLTNWVTLVLMSFSSLGVLQVMRERRKVLCACLGTAIRLPLTTVTLVEDLGMAAMALLMLVLH
jgi:hypothetical protein